MEILSDMSFNNILSENNIIILEIGNSRLKIDNGLDIDFYDYTYSNKDIDEKKIIEFLNEKLIKYKPTKIYYSSVNPSIENLLYVNFEIKNINNYLSLSGIDFSDISDMGIDRKLGLIAANELYGSSILTIDCGTAQTYNISINKKCLGGYITPGFKTRLKSLFENTNIPEIEYDEILFSNEIGKNSKDAIINGIYQSMLSEIKYFIENLNSKYVDLQIVLTGGNSFYFSNLLKENDFSLILHENLVNDGIKVILSKIYDKQ